VIDVVDSIRSAIAGLVWGASLAALPPGRRALVKTLRIAHMLAREIAEGTLTLRAASLVFTTLLSLVPLLAVSFSLLRAFGVRDRLEHVLFGFLEPLGERGREIGWRIVGFVDQVNVGMLGGVGLLILLFTVMSLLQKVEAALNASWRVHEPRSFVQRFSGYLSVLLVGPLLVFGAVGLIGTTLGTPLVRTLAEVEPFGTVLAALAQLVPYALTIAAFSFVYALMPNTRVRTSSALVGGAVAGVLWASAGWAFASFVVNSPSSYAAIYSSFAIVFFFMLWLYVAWLILLVGGTVAFYHQHPEYLGVMPGELAASNRLRERLALAVMVRIGRSHHDAAPPPDVESMTTALGVPAALLRETLDALMAAGFVARAEAPARGYLPARDTGMIRLHEILRAVRGAHEHRALVSERLPGEPEVDALMDELEQGAAAVLGERSLRDVVAGAAPGRGAQPAVALERRR